MSKGKKQSLTSLERDLLAAVRGPRHEISISLIKQRGLIAVLREKSRRQASLRAT